MDNIIFKKLSDSHFPLLLKWLESPHIKEWWDRDVKWTKELIENKYSNYTKGYKVITTHDVRDSYVFNSPLDDDQSTQKPIHAFCST